MTNLIQTTFQNLIASNNKALIPFLTADFPTRKLFNTFLHGLAESGASIIEIGIPFSDPMADGVIIQKTSEIAIGNGFTISHLFEDIIAFKETFPHIPIVLMTYLNPLIHYGMDHFLISAKKAGVDGLLIVDLPPENFARVITDDHGISMIRLVTPTTDMDRLSIINSSASGFIYYVSVKGITGTQTPDPNKIQLHLSQINQLIKLPMVIGFGINSIETAQSMAQISNGIVIGSRLMAPFLSADESAFNALIKDQLSYIKEISMAINHG